MGLLSWSLEICVNAMSRPLSEIEVRITNIRCRLTIARVAVCCQQSVFRNGLSTKPVCVVGGEVNTETNENSFVPLLRRTQT